MTEKRHISFILSNTIKFNIYGSNQNLIIHTFTGVTHWKKRSLVQNKINMEKNHLELQRSSFWHMHVRVLAVCVCVCLHECQKAMRQENMNKTKQNDKKKTTVEYVQRPRKYEVRLSYTMCNALIQCFLSIQNKTKQKNTNIFPSTLR